MRTVEIFKTDVRKKREANKITMALSAQYPAYKINFDLEDVDNILRVEAYQLEIKTSDIVNSMIDLGYSCDPIE